MKKFMSLLLVVMMLCVLALPASAAPSAPVITMQPQNPNYPEYSVATYTVKASGSNLTATWYMNWQGNTYEISDFGGAMEPWEAYAGERYGASKPDSNTFTYFFEGISHELNGATIWCVIEDGHNDVTSQVAYITLGNPATPPEILEFPAQITVQQGQQAQIRCVACTNDGSQLGYIWYETTSGQLPDIKALPNCTEYGDSITCDTSTVGTRYYVCAVNTANGGMTYSSVVPVTVTAAPAVTAPAIETTTLPQAMVGQSYSVKLDCSDLNAEFFIYYNPGKANDFEATGLTLGSNGQITGTPKAPGSYTFCVCASNAGGEDYMVYTLDVVQPAVPEETTIATQAVTEPVQNATEEITEPTEATEETSPAGADKGFWDGSVWLIALVTALACIVVAGAVVAVIVIVIVLKKSKKVKG